MEPSGTPPEPGTICVPMSSQKGISWSFSPDPGTPGDTSWNSDTWVHQGTVVLTHAHVSVPGPKGTLAAPPLVLTKAVLRILVLSLGLV